MHYFKATYALAAFMTATTLVAQQAAPSQDQQPDTSLSSTPTPQSTLAQGAAHRAPNPNQQAKHLAKQLGLNQEQTAKLKTILADRDQQVEQLRADTTTARHDRQARLQTIRQDSTAKIEAVLTDEQKQQYEQLLAARRNRTPKA